MAERRADLEAVQVSLPNYISDKILPWFDRKQVAGTMYYQALKSDFSAQYNRNTAAIADISAETIAAASTTFSCIETRGRVRMGYDQVRGYADKAHADLAMGRLAKRAFYNKVESLVAAQVLANPVDVTDDPVTAIDEEVVKLQDKAQGDVWLVISNRNFVALKNNSTVKQRMQNTGVVLGQGGDPRYVTAEQIAAIFGVKGLLIGRDDLWYSAVTGSAKGSVALVVLPEAAIEPAEACQYGRMVYFDYDTAATHFVMESFHSDKEDADYVDAKGFVDVKILNSGLCKALQVFEVAEESSSSGA